MQQVAPLFDHLVGGYEQAGRDRQAKRLRRFEIDHRFKFGRRLHRQIGGLVAAQDAVDIGRRLAKHVGEVDSVGHEPASRDERTDRVHRGQSVTGRERDNQVTMGDGRDVRRQHQAAVRRARKGLDGALDLGGIRHQGGYQVDPE